jgi:hypothetical protein
MADKFLAGTSKGLVIIDEAKDQWNISGVQFEGLPISLLYVDERSGMWWTGISHRHWGEKLHFSADKGKTWTEAATPNFRNYFYRPGQPASLKRLWTMQHGGRDRPGCLWLGTEPAGLFFSGDNGNSWQLTESLWSHPSRLDDQQWFGAGKDFPFIHSIVLDPTDSNHIYIAVSCAGVFESKDTGKNWQSKNKGLIAAYLPRPDAEVGHDPHRMMLCQAHPSVIWQQNHCGIFRTENGGENWAMVSGKDGFPNYGFALAIDDDDPQTAWVIPAQSDEMRIPVDLRLTVCKTIDGGKNWVSVSQGLPNHFSFDIVLRHAFAKYGNTLACGSNNGNIYLSDIRNESWVTVARNLSMVNCIAFAR